MVRGHERKKLPTNGSDNSLGKGASVPLSKRPSKLPARRRGRPRSLLSPHSPPHPSHPYNNGFSLPTSGRPPSPSPRPLFPPPGIHPPAGCPSEPPSRGPSPSAIGTVFSELDTSDISNLPTPISANNARPKPSPPRPRSRKGPPPRQEILGEPPLPPPPPPRPNYPPQCGPQPYSDRRPPSLNSPVDPTSNYGHRPLLPRPPPLFSGAAYGRSPSPPSLTVQEWDQLLTQSPASFLSQPPYELQLPFPFGKPVYDHEGNLIPGTTPLTWPSQGSPETGTKSVSPDNRSRSQTRRVTLKISSSENASRTASGNHTSPPSVLPKDPVGRAKLERNRSLARLARRRKPRISPRPVNREMNFAREIGLNRAGGVLPLKLWAGDDEPYPALRADGCAGWGSRGLGKGNDRNHLGMWEIVLSSDDESESADGDTELSDEESVSNAATQERNEETRHRNAGGTILGARVFARRNIAAWHFALSGGAAEDRVASNMDEADAAGILWGVD
jgi:hypothetical protein